MSKITHLQPPGLLRSPAFAQAIRIPADHDLLVIGGQNGVDEAGAVVGEDLRSQTRRALQNVEACLREAGAGWENVVQLTVSVMNGQPLREGFEEYAAAWAGRPHPPTVTARFVESLVVPGAVCEIEALAALPPG